MLPLLQSRDRIDIEVDTEPVAEFVGDGLRINADLPGKAGMGAVQDLKGGPFQANRLETRSYPPSPGGISV